MRMVGDFDEVVKQGVRAMRLNGFPGGMRVAQGLGYAALVGAVLVSAGSASAVAMGNRMSEVQPSRASAQGYLGVMVADVGDEQAGLRLKDGHGAVITHVDHDGPAGKMGLRTRDVVLQLNGVVLEGAEQMRHILREMAPGRSVTMLVNRDGQQLTLTAQMADRAEVDRQVWRDHLGDPQAPATGFPTGAVAAADPAAPAGGTVSGGRYSRSFLGSLLPNPSYTGVMLEKMGPQLAGFFGVQGGPGMLVKGVEVNSPASMAGIKAGDVIVRANAHAVGSMSEWVKLVKESKGGPVTVVVVRDRTERTVTLTPDTKRRSCVDGVGIGPGEVEVAGEMTL